MSGGIYSSKDIRRLQIVLYTLVGVYSASMITLVWYLTTLN